ncbi:MAG: 4-hydroxy-tetrahydrodipicolinate reductase [Bacteroidetes bacterium]|nr:MAG: 4-hydroxy-tetrahydrodipicolinate reductase [Bacteroidota bacterium]
MRITLIGYGKMGKTIEKIALQRGHSIAHIIDQHNVQDLALVSPANTDVAIEFTNPESAVLNLRQCIAQGVPVVCGSTGWLQHKPDIEKACLQQKGAFFYASNYSVGVNIFFRLNAYLASMMSKQLAYRASMEEIHHTEKKDAPSGTAITLAEGVLQHLTTLQQWVNEPTENPTDLPIISKREPNVPGTHSVVYASPVDEIEIKHTAHSREGFATGAVLASEWLQGRQGVFGMEDMLGF